MSYRIFILLSLIFSSIVNADISSYFNSIHHNPQALNTFFAKMPKGGELHYHLSGGATPEVMLNIASKNHYCLDTKTFTLTEMTTNCTGIDSFGLKSKPELYTSTLRAWSMQDFNPGIETSYEHFFNTFFKFNPIVVHHSVELLKDVMQRAAEQNESYLEVMILPDDNKSSEWNTLIQHVPSFAKKREILLANPLFLKNIRNTKANAHQLLKKTRDELKCNQGNSNKACGLTVKFQYIILREQRVNQFFAQALNAFESADNSSDIAGINLVQAEHGPLSLKNYTIQMQILRFLHKIYPHVPIALHAGEFGSLLLKQNKIKREDMGFHIHDAIFVGQASRIGHGTDLLHEKNYEKTVEYMAARQIPVEISFTSNRTILGVSPKDHPIFSYLKHSVPIVISTDDEGLLRTNLTKQYVIAAHNYNLDYPTLKNMNRNTLTYSFLRGKSIWQDPKNGIRIKECNSLKSSSCINFINKNLKAKLQWQLERDLIKFEKSQDLNNNLYQSYIPAINLHNTQVGTKGTFLIPQRNFNLSCEIQCKTL